MMPQRPKVLIIDDTPANLGFGVQRNGQSS